MSNTDENWMSNYSASIDKALLLFMTGRYNDFLYFIMNDCDVRIVSREMVLLMHIASERIGDNKRASKFKSILMETIKDKSIRM